MLENSTVIAIYSYSTGAILGVSGDVARTPLCDIGASVAYPDLPNSRELLWVIESVYVMPWTIVFEPNGGTGTMFDDNTVEVKGGENSPALTNVFKKAGYSFVGWLDNEGTTHVDGAKINRELYVSGYVLTLTAQWKEESVRVTYAASAGGAVQLGRSGAAGSSVSETVGAATGIVLGTSSQTFSGSTAVANRGYHFTGWTVSGVPNGAAKNDLDFSEKSSTSISGSTVSSLSVATDSAANKATYHPLSFTSNFAANTYTVNYDANGGSGELAASSTRYGSSSTQASSSGVSRSGYTLSGWNTEADGSGVSVAPGATLSSSTLDRIIASGKLSGSGDDSTTLYAQWRENPAPVEEAKVKEKTEEPVEDSTADEAEAAAPAYFLPVFVGEVIQPAAGAAETATSETATALADKAERALEVEAVSSSPIVTAGATGASGQVAGEGEGGTSLVEAFANMTSAEKVQVAGSVVTAVAAVSALAGLLGVGASVVGVFAAGLLGIAGTAGATGAADLAAELAAASAASGAAGRKGRRRKRVAAAGEDNDDDKGESE